jgi:hypothetical protein
VLSDSVGRGLTVGSRAAIASCGFSDRIDSVTFRRSRNGRLEFRGETSKTRSITWRPPLSGPDPPLDVLQVIGGRACFFEPHPLGVGTHQTSKRTAINRKPRPSATLTAVVSFFVHKPEHPPPFWAPLVKRSTTCDAWHNEFVATAHRVSPMCFAVTRLAATCRYALVAVSVALLAGQTPSTS